MNWEELLAGTQAAVTGIVTLIVTAVAVLLGAFFIYSGISKMLAHSRGERQGQSTAGPVAGNLLLGALMVQLAWTIDMISVTMFGATPDSPNSAMQYMPDPVASNPMLSQMINVGVLWVFCIGFVAIVRGFVLWNTMVSGNQRGQDEGWRGFWHIFFGAMAVNLTAVIRMLTSGG
jgi:hypothetical protein